MNEVALTIKAAVVALFQRGDMKELGSSASQISRQIADRLDSALDSLVSEGVLFSEKKSYYGKDYINYVLADGHIDKAKIFSRGVPPGSRLQAQMAKVSRWLEENDTDHLGVRQSRIDRAVPNVYGTYTSDARKALIEQGFIKVVEGRTSRGTATKMHTLIKSYDKE